MEQHARRLNGREICALIKSGSEFGVTRITISGDSVTIEYGGAILAPETTIMVPEPSPAVKNELAELHYDEVIEQIKLSDPDRYEQLLADGVIEDINEDD